MKVALQRLGIEVAQSHSVSTPPHPRIYKGNPTPPLQNKKLITFSFSKFSISLDQTLFAYELSWFLLPLSLCPSEIDETTAQPSSSSLLKYLFPLTSFICRCNRRQLIWGEEDRNNAQFGRRRYEEGRTRLFGSFSNFLDLQSSNKVVSLFQVHSFWFLFSLSFLLVGLIPSVSSNA